MLSDLLRTWNPWRGLGDLPRDIWTLFAASLINRMGTMVLPFLVLYLTQDLGFPAGRAGLVLTFYGLGALVAAPISGRLCDRLGPVRVMRWSLVLSAATFVAFPIARSWPAVMAATAVLSIFSEAARPAMLSMLTDLVPAERRKAAFAVNRLAINLGMSIGPAAGGFIAEHSFKGLFFVNAAATLLAAGVLSVFPLRIAHHDPIAGEAAAGRSRTAWRDGLFLAFLAAQIPVAVVFFQHEGALPLYLVRDLGLTESFYGMLFTVNTVLIVLLEVRLNLSTTHWSAARTLALGTILLGIGFGALAVAHRPGSVVATVVVWTFGEMILLPAMSNYVAGIAPRDRRGEYMGLYSMSWGIAFGFGPWIGTEIMDAFGARTLWIGTFVVCAATAAALARFPEARTPAGEEGS